MIHVVASIRIKPGKREEFLEIFNDNVPNVLVEKGCIEYGPTIDVETDISVQKSDPNVVTIIEKWETLEDLKVHLTAPHILAYREKVADIVESLSLKVLQPA